MGTFAIVLFLIASACNCFAAWQNLRLARRARKELEANRETFAKLIGFAAFMSRPESGAPEAVRELARQMLPEDIRIEVTKLGSSTPTLH
jgi:hypothetical protein